MTSYRRPVNQGHNVYATVVALERRRHYRHINVEFGGPTRLAGN